MSCFTADLFADWFKPVSLSRGIFAEPYVAPYNQILQQTTNANSELYKQKCDVIFLGLDHRWFGFDRFEEDHRNAADKLAKALEDVAIIFQSLKENTSSEVIISNLVCQQRSLFGSYDHLVPGTQTNLTSAFNAKLLEMTKEANFLLFDINRLCAKVGFESWFDQQSWYECQAPFNPHYSDIFSDNLLRIVAAIKGKSKKCLVLDLDNTLWDGVIGDDGLSGINVSSGDPKGEAHLDIQKYAADLKKRGIILAVCSKNFEKVAKEPFQKHPWMYLKETDISCFKANWTAKSENLKQIAQELNLGVDSLVLLDDNPAERFEVRSELPMVGVPELPDNVFGFWSGLMQQVILKLANLRRTTSCGLIIIFNRKTGWNCKGSANISDYLKKLNMQIVIENAQDIHLNRVYQLINKTNQFNLTTVRHSSDEIETMCVSSEYIVKVVSLSDKFGDAGVISVVILKTSETSDKKEEPLASVITWLMSCRVLGRRVEYEILNQIAAELKEMGVFILNGSYIPTTKNQLVENFYDELGFDVLEHTKQQKLYTLDLQNYEPKQTYFHHNNSQT